MDAGHLALTSPCPHPDGTWHGIVSYQEGFSGFGSAAVILMTAMFVFGIEGRNHSRGLERIQPDVPIMFTKTDLSAMLRQEDDKILAQH